MHSEKSFLNKLLKNFCLDSRLLQRVHGRTQNFSNRFNLLTIRVVYMSSTFWLLAIGSCDLSQAEAQSFCSLVILLVGSVCIRFQGLVCLSSFSLLKLMKTEPTSKITNEQKDQASERKNACKAEQLLKVTTTGRLISKAFFLVHNSSKKQ